MNHWKVPNDIVHQLKCFSHVDQSVVNEVNLNDTIENTLKIVWNEIKYKADVEKNYGEIPPYKCNVAELNQVFMNIFVNAAHAIKEHGTITVTTVLEGENIIIRISDSGCGIKPENLKNLFDPFFTTKPVGEGTGLGLSISYGIIEKHSGSIEVESELGKGTTFIIKLPITANQLDGNEVSEEKLQASI
jgi:two-component system NtrC family sensor kinase